MPAESGVSVCWWDVQETAGSDGGCSCRSRRQSRRCFRTSSRALGAAAAAALAAAEALAGPEAEAALRPEAGAAAGSAGAAAAATTTSNRCACSQSRLMCRMAYELGLHQGVVGGSPTMA